MTSEWDDSQHWEASWWGTCINTYGEEEKQLHYVKKMSLDLKHDSQGPFVDLQGKSVLDIGGGPVSFLLKCRNRGKAVVIDPCDYPKWIDERYKIANIEYRRIRGEDIDTSEVYDEVWIYNVLQHVEDPAKIVANARKVSKLIRVFDWLEISGIGHPQHLLEPKMNEWFGGFGKVERGNGGKEYSGIFLGDHYEK